MQLGVSTDTLWLLGRVLAALSLVVALGVAGLALYGYWRNDSRPMLFLGGGIATLVVGSWAAAAVSFSLFRAGAVGLVARSALQLTGLGMILYSIVLARQQ